MRMTASSGFQAPRKSMTLSLPFSRNSRKVVFCCILTWNRVSALSFSSLHSLRYINSKGTNFRFLQGAQDKGTLFLFLTTLNSPLGENPWLDVADGGVGVMVRSSISEIRSSSPFIKQYPVVGASILCQIGWLSSPSCPSTVSNLIGGTPRVSEIYQRSMRKLLCVWCFRDFAISWICLSELQPPVTHSLKPCARDCTQERAAAGVRWLLLLNESPVDGGWNPASKVRRIELFSPH